MNIIKRYYAAFHNDTQITPWTTDKNRTLTSIRRSLGLRHGVYVKPNSKRAQRLKAMSIHSQNFLEKRGEA